MRGITGTHCASHLSLSASVPRVFLMAAPPAIIVARGGKMLVHLKERERESAGFYSSSYQVNKKRDLRERSWPENLRRKEVEGRGAAEEGGPRR